MKKKNGGGGTYRKMEALHDQGRGSQKKHWPQNKAPPPTILTGEAHPPPFHVWLLGSSKYK